MNKEPSKKDIQLILYTPNEPIRCVNVKSRAKIQILNTIYGSNTRSFIYNGIELSTFRTFGSYGMSNQDIIISIPNKPKHAYFLQKWLNIAKDNDEFNHKIKSMINPKTASEAARLNDMYFSKLERRPRIYQKLCFKCINSNIKYIHSPIPLNIDSSSTNEPSTEPLPVFWSIEDDV